MPLCVSFLVTKCHKNGFFFFSTPNTKSFEWFVAGKDHGQILPPGHINLLNI